MSPAVLVYAVLVMDWEQPDSPQKGSPFDGVSPPLESWYFKQPDPVDSFGKLCGTPLDPIIVLLRQSQ